MTTPAELQAIRERDEFTLYKRIGEVEARPSTADDWVHRVERRISVSPADFDAGYRGGMIARNPANHDVSFTPSTTPAPCENCGGSGLIMEHPKDVPFSQSLAAIGECPVCKS